LQKGGGEFPPLSVFLFSFKSLHNLYNLIWAVSRSDELITEKDFIWMACLLAPNANANIPMKMAAFSSVRNAIMNGAPPL
jgi:hypothetical protein